MSDVKAPEKDKKLEKRKKIIKLVSVAVLFVTVVIVFTIAWFTYFKTDEVGGLSMTAVGRDSIEGTINAYYSTDGSSGDGNWGELDENGIDVLPDKSIIVKLIVSNSSEQAVNYKLKYSSLKVKYYKIQPFDKSVWTADTDYWQNTTTNEEFGYDKSYVMAGDYADDSGKIIDYHKITTAQYMEFLKPATNALRYNVCGFKTVTGDTTDEQLTNAKNENMPAADYNNAIAKVKESLTPVICETNKQDLTELNVTDPVDVVPKDNSIDLFIGNILDGQTGTDTENYMGTDGVIHLQAKTTAVVFMTIYFDPAIYSSASLNIDGTEKNVTLRNSNPFMYQYVYLNGIKLEVVK